MLVLLAAVKTGERHVQRLPCGPDIRAFLPLLPLSKRVRGTFSAQHR
jgi:hypothetical protein